MDSVVVEDPTLPVDIEYSILTPTPSTHDEDVNLEGELLVGNSHSSGVVTPSTAGESDQSATDVFSTPQLMQTPQKNFNSDFLPSYIDNMENIMDSRMMSPLSKDYSKKISDLKKENFALKLRIYYMKENMNITVEHQELFQLNIEYKMEVDALKKELENKNKLLLKASAAVKCMENRIPDELERAKRHVEEMKENEIEMQNKIENLEKEKWETEQSANETKQLLLQRDYEFQARKDEVTKLQAQLQALKDATPHKRRLSFASDSDLVRDLKEELKDANEEVEEKQSTIGRLTECLKSKQTVIDLLNEGKMDKKKNEQTQQYIIQIDELQRKYNEKELALKESEESEEKARKGYLDLVILHEEYQEHITEQQQRLDDFENATKQMTEELDKREKDNKELEKELQQSKDSYDDLNGKNQEMDEEIRKSKREITKRDRAIHGFNKLLVAKENEIDKLTDEIKDYENKAFEIGDQLHKLQVKTPHNENREKVIAQLRLQLQESDKTLQECLDERNKVDENHSNEMRGLRNQIMDIERSNERQKNQLSSNDELINKLDGIIKEKDEELQNILNKFKIVTRDLKLKEDESSRLALQRDQLSEQLHVEKARFGELADKLLQLNSSQAAASGENSEWNLKNEQRMWDLEDQLRSKQRELDEVCREKDKCQLEMQQLRKDLDKMSQQKEEEVNSKQDQLAACNNKIVMLTSSLEKSNVLRRQAEDKLLAETDEFKRMTDELQQKLTSCKNELDKLRQEKSSCFSPSIQTLGSGCSDLLDIDPFPPVFSPEPENNYLACDNYNEASYVASSARNSVSLSFWSDNDDDDLINKLYDEIDMKDQEIQMLHSSNSRPVYILEEERSLGESESHSGSHHTSTDHTHHYDVTNHQKEGGDNEHITYSYNVINQAQAQHQMQAPQERLQIMQSSVKENKSSRVLQEDIKQVQNSVDEINRTLTTRNETVNTTFGNVIGQTSFVQMQPSFRFNDDRELLDLGVNDLRQALREYKSELRGAAKDLEKLDESSRNQAREITNLKGKISKIENERENLINEKKTINKEKENHEEEIKELKEKIHKLKNGESESGITQLSNQQHHGSFVTSHLGVNSIGGNFGGSRRSGISSSKVTSFACDATMTSHSDDDGDDVTSYKLMSKSELGEKIGYLKKELQREENKNKLNIAQAERVAKEASKKIEDKNERIKDLMMELDEVKNKLHLNELDEIDRNASRILEAATQPIQSVFEQQMLDLDKSDLTRALSVNRKLREQLNENKQKLSATEQKVRQQSEKLKKYASVVNLSQLGVGDSDAMTSVNKTIRTYASVPNLNENEEFGPADTSEVGTQTNYDSGYSSQSSISSLNSVIHQQSKELSNLRGKLQNARTAYKQLSSQMDVLSNYINSLVASGGSNLDAYSASDVASELMRSRKIVGKVRRALSTSSSRNRMSDCDVMTASSLCGSDEDAKLESNPSIARIHNEQISRLTNQLANRNKIIADLRDDVKLRHNTSYPTTKLERSKFVTHSVTSNHDLNQDGDNFHGNKRSSKSPKKLSNSLPVRRHRSDYDVINSSIVRHGVLTPSTSLNSLLLSDVDCNDVTMNVMEESDDSLKQLLGNSGTIKILSTHKSTPIRRNLFHASPRHDNDVIKCHTEVSGAWKPQSKPVASPSNRKIKINVRNSEESSCEENMTLLRHNQEREMERLRRRLNDSKKLNRSLKEELDLSTTSLKKVKIQIDNDKIKNKNKLIESPSYIRMSANFDLLLDHLKEIRSLRQRLEKSIETNDLLRLKLEEKLKGGETSPVTRNKLAKFEHEIESLKTQLETKDRQLKASESLGKNLNDEIEKTKQHNIILAGTLQQLQNEVDKQNDMCNRITEASRTDKLKLEEKLRLSEYDQQKLNDQIRKLSDERNEAYREYQNATKLANQFEQEVLKVQARIKESDKIILSLQHGKNHSRDNGTMEVLNEISKLRHQLENNVTSNKQLKQQLDCGDSVSVVKYNSDGPYMVCKTSSFQNLKENVESIASMTSQLRGNLSSAVDYDVITMKLGEFSNKACFVARDEFWPASCDVISKSDAKNLPHINSENSELHKEVRRLKGEVAKQDNLLRCTLNKLQKQREVKSEIESSVVEQIKYNCGLLTQAKSNLQKSRHGSVENLHRKKFKKQRTTLT